MSLRLLLLVVLLSLFLIVHGSRPSHDGATSSGLLVQRPMPKGDWVATIQYRVDFEARNGSVFLGFGDWSRNVVEVRLWSEAQPSAAYARVGLERVSEGERTAFARMRASVDGGRDRAASLLALQRRLPDCYQVRLTKRGRLFAAAFREPDAAWIELEPWWESSVPWQPTLPELGAGAELRFGSDSTEEFGRAGLTIEWIKVEPSPRRV